MKWRGHLNSISDKGNKKFSHCLLVSTQLKKKKKKMKWWFIFLNAVTDRRRQLTHVLRRLWPRSVFPKLVAHQNPLGNFKHLEVPGHSWADLLIENLHGWDAETDILGETLIRWFWCHQRALTDGSALENPTVWLLWSPPSLWRKVSKWEERKMKTQKQTVAIAICALYLPVLLQFFLIRKADFVRSSAYPWEKYASTLIWGTLLGACGDLESTGISQWREALCGK